MTSSRAAQVVAGTVCGALAALVIAGCGSSHSSAASSTASSAAPPSAPAANPAHPSSEIRFSGEQVAEDLEQGRLERACEGFTAETRTRLEHFPQGCTGALSVARTAAGKTGAKTFGHLFRQALLTRLPLLKIKGEVALYRGIVEARYEEGRWRFETHGSL